ncbi:MAG: hypothetical protein V1900_04530 [Candidatus Aenigmatarchaeota archaeon]
MICVVAMIVFGFLGLFSVKYRNYFKEASRCIFRRMTLRKCDTQFDQKMKSKIISKLMMRSQKLAKFTYKYFEPISWFFMITLILSLVFAANGVYNIVVHGSCDPSDPEGCIFGVEQVCTCADCNATTTYGSCNCTDGCGTCG